AKRTHGRAKRTHGGAKRTRGRAKRTRGRAKRTRGRAKRTRGRAKRTRGRAKRTRGRAKRTRGRAKRTRGRAKRTRGRAKRTRGRAKRTRGRDPWKSQKDPWKSQKDPWKSQKDPWKSQKDLHGRAKRTHGRAKRTRGCSRLNSSYLFVQWDDTFWDDSLLFVGNVGAMLEQRNVEASPMLLVGTMDGCWWEKWSGCRSPAIGVPVCRRRTFIRVAQHNRRGMEKAVPSFSERQGDGGRALLMPPEPTNESFPALECPQGDERRGAFLQDAKKALENPALAGSSLETEAELEEDAFYAEDDLETMSREGKGPSSIELCPLQEEPDFFSSLARQEPDVALEAHDVA
ncbi:PREDICTED: leucine zipper protein 4, partial [Nestor notabilis]|uniref:leucine zipper protein 4 n=1 Tax=Nestor notabilis TaxID=176057 RepID=UPI000523C426